MTSCHELESALARDPAELAPELADHARGCPRCAEAAGVAALLRRAAREQPPRAGLPSAGHLWWRARILRDLVAKDSLTEQAVRPSRWTQVAALAVFSLLLALGLGLLTASLFSGLQAEVAAGSMPWGWLSGLLLAGTVLPCAAFAAWWLLSDY